MPVRFRIKFRGVAVEWEGWARAHPLFYVAFLEKGHLTTCFLLEVEKFLVLPTHCKEASYIPYQCDKKLQCDGQTDTHIRTDWNKNWKRNLDESCTNFFIQSRSNVIFCQRLNMSFSILQKRVMCLKSGKDKKQERKPMKQKCIRIDAFTNFKKTTLSYHTVERLHTLLKLLFQQWWI